MNTEDDWGSARCRQGLWPKMVLSIAHQSVRRLSQHAATAATGPPAACHNTPDDGRSDEGDVGRVRKNEGDDN